MLVIPAMDIRCGKFVHLMSVPVQEELADMEDPVDVALWWEKKGAKMLQVTDLDGAFTGCPENLDTLAEIIESVEVPLQVSGGIRTLKHINEVLALGVKRVILGTAAVRDPDLIRQACQDFGEQIAVGIEGKNNMVAIEGWNQPTDWTIKDMGIHLKTLGVKRVMFSDTRRYGSLRGPNLVAARELAEEVGLKVIIAGGVSSYKDLEEIEKLTPLGIEGVVVGKALYSGIITLNRKPAKV